MFEQKKSPQYSKILLALIALIIASSALDESVITYVVFTLSLLLTFGTIIFRIRKKKSSLIIALVSGSVAFVTGLIGAIPNMLDIYVETFFSICVFSYAVFILISIMVISKSVFVTDDVTSDRIIGSICIYLLIGMFFAFIYAGLGLLDVERFTIGNAPMTVKSYADVLYFSFVTLTTTGYGDIVPSCSLTKMLASLEAVTGSLYIAIVIARLVGMHISQKNRSKNSC